MVKKSIDVKVRPLTNQSLEKASLLGAARVYISKDSLIALTGSLESGKTCFLERLDEAQDGLRREASLWILPEKNLSPNVVMMTRAFQEATGFKLGDQVRVSLAGASSEAEEVVVQDIDDAGTEEMVSKHEPGWDFSISYSMDRAEHVFPGMVFEGVSVNKLRRSFKVVSVNGQTTNLARFKLASSSVRILRPDEEDAALDDFSGGELVVSGVPGLSAQVEAVNNFLRPFCRPFRIKGERASCGLVLHGGHGTGKTFILQKLAETKWGRPHWIEPSDKLSTIRETFRQARASQPSMVFIDALEDLIGKERSNRDAVIQAIGEELDSLSAEASANDALPRVVVMATCSDYMTDVPIKLQNRSRFRRNIALPIPRASERLEILRFLDPEIKADEKEQLLHEVAQSTHAYNGNDLTDLVLTSKEILGTRLDKGEAAPGEHFLTRMDIEQALTVTRPSAMRDINLKPPTIHWQDVGGQASLKKVLARMIKNTKSANSAARQVLRHPPKGLLLYGPPGCSKTLSAQAMATESGFNFFAVKGAELLNMYVGESERAVRTLFERARAASPSIIFFDEIDSIGGQRSGPGSAGSRSTGSVNMLTTLLTEMDGFEALTGVLILAATNRPESMDPALLRPGRFDQIVYVGPPDQPAREAVFEVHLRGLSIAADVDIPELARLADGHSGAEIKAICAQAGQEALERYEDENENENGNGDREGDEAGADDRPQPHITMADLVGVLERSPRNITKQMIDGYERWSKQFRKV